MTTSPALHNLYGRLAKVGIPREFARRTLPSWWDDSITNEPSGVQQAELLFARAFNIDVASFSAETPKFRAVERKFKLNKNIAQDEVSASAHYAAAVARIALAALPSNEYAFPPDPLELRNYILGFSKCVDLPGLLAACRSLAIPVIHVGSFPGKKVTGLAVRIADRYAIILGHSKHPSYLLFNLAHEVGHIACGHLQRDGFIADEKIETGAGADDDEKAANRYAGVLLNGQELQYKAARGVLSAMDLCRSAQTKSAEARVDAGHIILNYANYSDFAGKFAVANAALKLLGGEPRGEVVVNNALRDALDWTRLSEEQADLLRFAAGLSA